MNPDILTMLPLGKTIDSDLLDDFLGYVVWDEGKAYRLVKAAAQITAPEGKILVTAVSSGVPTWVAGSTTTANDTHVLGTIPAAYASTIAADARFWVQCSGPGRLLSAAAIADNALVGTSTTAFKGDDANITAGVGAIGTANEAASAGDEIIDITIKGIL